MVKNPYRFYTYAYLREDRTPYYIGKGTEKRLYTKSKNEIKPPKDKSRIIFLKQNLLEEDAFKHEIYMIAVFGRKDLGTGILLNRTGGGDGGSNDFEETRRKKSRPGKLNGMYGKKRPPELISKLVAASVNNSKGKTYEEIYGEERAKIIKQKRSLTLQKPKSESHKEKCRENGIKGGLKIADARKGKTLDEIYSKEIAEKMKGLRKGKTWDEIYGKETADRMRELNRIRNLNKSKKELNV